VPEHQQDAGCAFRLRPRVEAFGAGGELRRGGNQTANRRAAGLWPASGTAKAAPYLNFFLDVYATAYRAEIATPPPASSAWSRA